jgi:hypothetical protein
MDACRRNVRRPYAIGAALTAALAFSTPPVFAQNQTEQGKICMQRVFNGPGVPTTNSNRLNCTANDVRISGAISAINLDTGLSSCIEGVPFTLQATFLTDVTANSRYDETYFFRLDGGPNARGDGTNATGLCSVTQLDNSGDPGSNLDGDTCGDLNAGSYEFSVTIPNVDCTDTNDDGFLNLPNCTSWHSNQGTLCDLGDVFTSDPDTKSKCTCDDTFQVPITVESPSGAVEKTATKAVVTYEVKVKNNSVTRTVKITSLVDDLYGDLATRSGSTCGNLIDAILAPGATSAACTFTAEYLDPGTAGTKTNTITAHVEDTANASNAADLTGSTTIDVQLNITP